MSSDHQFQLLFLILLPGFKLCQEQPEVTSTTVDAGTNSEKSVAGQHRKASKRRQKKKKKSLESTMSTDHSQAHPEQQESTIIIKKTDQPKQEELTSTTVAGGTNSEQQQQQKPHNREELGNTYSEKVIRAETQRLLTEFEQLDLTSTTVDGETHSKEVSTVEPRKTREQREAIYKREFSQNCVKAARLSERGTVIYRYIPTRSFWMRMCREEWGVTLEETTTLIKDNRSHHFYIDICGSYMGYGVILRDSMKNPIVALSSILDHHISQFYSDLQGVSEGLKLAIKYNIRHFVMVCSSDYIPQYVMLSWAKKDECSCPARDDPDNPEKKKSYCVDCSRSLLHEIGEKGNAGKILPLIDEIFYDALEFKGFIYFNMHTDELSRLKAVCHLANSGMEQELRLPEIEEDEKLAEILYKDVYRHISEEEVVQYQQLMLQKH
ncbi:uncharacterized protein LOC113328902 isoform X1 [Papaver somniferum]|uniref:uncharacterized protein LOC113328902 isoform X1 n=2 Tax=Papaver somniferum TaxID=3469 RepID=UPI000E6FCE26|nr:uncharacterized protein LOC113328902 isoform X1 [Papaver somniferum]